MRRSLRGDLLNQSTQFKSHVEAEELGNLILLEEGGDKPASSETRDLEARGRITEASPPSQAEQALSNVHPPRKSK